MNLAPTLAAIVRAQTGVAWSRARSLCTDGRVTVNGARCLEPATRVSPDAVVVVDQHGPKVRAGPLAESAIVFFDRDVVVVDKPAGMLSVADEAGNRNTLADHARTLLRRIDKRGIDAKLGVVHRLDKETSGLLVFARTATAKRALAAQFFDHTVERIYHAIAHGVVSAATVDTWVLPDRGDGLRGSCMIPPSAASRRSPQGARALGRPSSSHGNFVRADAEPPPEARRSVTHIRPIARLDGATLVECRLETGRQHQIRIHLYELGHPLAGEPVYIRGYAGNIIESPRPMLHARTLGFAHPRTGQHVGFQSEWPGDFQAMVDALGGASQT